MRLPRPDRALATLAVVTLTGVLAACGSSVHAPLPDSSATVDKDAPLTHEQAAQVREQGRAVTQSIIDLLGAAEHVTPADDASSESWAGCTATSGPLTFGVHYDGVLYSTDVWFEPSTTVDADTMHQILAPAQITWEKDNPDVGTSGIYRVSIQRSPDLRVGVTSPCYFVRELTGADGGTLPPDDIAKVTGFVRQGWNQ
ncbi:hypothetical protein ACWDTI_05500 [Gordonia sp. NPDC003424]